MKFVNQKYTLLCAWIVSITAMSGSLYFSEIKQFIPCELCWYQRILMYPLVLILGIAFFKKNYKIYQYVLPFSTLGMVVSSYHYYLQKKPLDTSINFCTSGCTGQYINYFGFITIPFLALIAFTLITIGMFVLRSLSKKENA